MNSPWMVALLLFTQIAGVQTRAQQTELRKEAYVPASANRAKAPGPSTPIEQLIFLQANQDRAQHGIPPLRWEPSLAAAARAHAAWMARASAISHQFAGELDLQTRTMQAGASFSMIAENVAVDTDPTAIDNAWMRSAGHRANLLNPQLDSIGVGLAQRGGEWFAAEDFSRSVVSMSFDQQEQTVAALVEQARVTVIHDPQTARESCAMDEGHAGARQPMFMMHYTSSSLSSLPAALAARLKSGKYKTALVGACAAGSSGGFSTYRIAVMLF